MGKQNRKLDVDPSVSVGVTKETPSAPPVSAATRIIDELRQTAPLRTGPQEEILEPLPPIPEAPPVRVWFYIPDEKMFEDIWL